MFVIRERHYAHPVYYILQHLRIFVVWDRAKDLEHSCLHQVPNYVLFTIRNQLNIICRITVQLIMNHLFFGISLNSIGRVIHVRTDEDLSFTYP